MSQSDKKLTLKIDADTSAASAAVQALRDQFSTLESSMPAAGGGGGVSASAAAMPSVDIDTTAITEALAGIHASIEAIAEAMTATGDVMTGTTSEAADAAEELIDAIDDIRATVNETADQITEATEQVADGSKKATKAVGDIGKKSEETASKGGRLSRVSSVTRGVASAATRAAAAVAGLSRRLISVSAAGLSRVGSSLAGMATSFLSTTAAAVGLTAGVGGVIAGIVGVAKAGAQLEQTRISFRTLMGDAAKGDAILNDLQQYANVTPFSTDEIVNSGKKLLGFGVQAQDVMGTLKMLGDVSAGTQKPIEELTFLFGKAFAKGRVDAEMLNQMIDAGIPIIERLADQYNVATKDIYKLAEQGKITGDDVRAAFQSMTAEGGKYFNLMEKQSQTVGGLFSTMMGKISLSAQLLGEQLAPIFSDILSTIIGYIDEIMAKIQDGSVIEWLAGAFTTAIDYVATFAKSFQGVWRGIKKTIDWVGSLVEGIMGAWGTIKGVIATIYDIVKGIITAIAGLLGHAVGFIIDGIQAVVNGALKAYNWVAGKFGSKGVGTWDSTFASDLAHGLGKAGFAESGRAFTDAFSGESYSRAKGGKILNADDNADIDNWANGLKEVVNGYATKILKNTADIAKNAGTDYSQEAKEERDSMFGAKKAKGGKSNTQVDSLARVGLYAYASEGAKQLIAVLDTNRLLTKIDDKLSQLSSKLSSGEVLS